MAKVSSWLAVALNTIKVRKPGRIALFIPTVVVSAAVISVVAIVVQYFDEETNLGGYLAMAICGALGSRYPSVIFGIARVKSRKRIIYLAIGTFVFLVVVACSILFGYLVGSFINYVVGLFVSAAAGVLIEVLSTPFSPENPKPNKTGQE